MLGTRVADPLLVRRVRFKLPVQRLAATGWACSLIVVHL